MESIVTKITNEAGLHARPAAEFVKLAAQFKALLQVRNVTTNSSWVDAKSILSVLTLGVEKEHDIELTADGVDAEVAIQAIRSLIETDFAGKL
jgi:phosphotransferase system HPr (HPr) family protein